MQMCIDSYKRLHREALYDYRSINVGSTSGGYPVLCKLHEKVAVDSYDIQKGYYGIETVDILYPILCSHDSFYSMTFLLCMQSAYPSSNCPLLSLSKH